MKKKNLAILLIIPFLISIFGVVAIQVTFNLIDNDVIRISWDYHENELFEVGQQFELKAQGVVADSRYPASEGNRLQWQVENSDGAEDAHAEVLFDGRDKWFLKTNSVGSVTITCFTEKGNVTPMHMTGIIYEGDAFVINPTVRGSGQNVDPTIYYGEYDLTDDLQKRPATVSFTVTVTEDSILDGLAVDTERTSRNLTVNLQNHTFTINGGRGTCTLALKNEGRRVSTEYTFSVVSGGVNVYNYAQLLACTNRSAEGEIVVLRTNFESKKNVEADSANNVALFGTAKGAGFDFAGEVYRCPTTYNSEFIAQWNKFAATDGNYRPVDENIVVGLRVQKSLYGNGYMLNLHNLCFPTSYTTQTDSATGEAHDYYTPGSGDLFRGPKPFYMIGDPNSTVPLVEAFGQDNVGVYLDGNNITLNDVKIKNCDFGLIVANLNYTGTVLEVHGDRNLIKNCVLSNGKNVLRSYSSMDLTVENCILSTARNFLFMTGSDRYEKNTPGDTATHAFTKLDGTIYNASLDDYIGPSQEGDNTLSLFATGFTSLDDVLGSDAPPPQVDKAAMKAALHSIQDGLTSSKVHPDDIDGTTEFVDTIFYRSGIASIGVESLFNGPFLYNKAPSMLAGILSLAGSMLDQAMPGYDSMEMNLSGTSYPVTVNLSGNTRFFDYKDLQSWDISGLIDQHIADIANSILSSSVDVTIDDIFPLKSILERRAREEHTVYVAKDGTSYISIPVAFYGGGKNYSSVTLDGLTAGGLTDAIDVDLLDSYLDLNATIDLSGGASGFLSSPGLVQYIKQVLTKTVTVVMGYEPFRFRFGNDPAGVFDTETDKPLIPDYRDLIRA